jgi:hypothetical protein
MEPRDDKPDTAGAPKPPTRRESLVPALAVTAVAVVAVAAAVMVRRADTHAPLQASIDASRSAAPAPSGAVVQAPPLRAPATHAMGSAAACKDCGVVEMVVAVQQPGGGKEPRAYQMHIRMDDGTRRVIEQRGALAAGSRVQVEGNVIRAAP